MAVQLDDYYPYSDVHETLDACQDLEILLSRLKRQHLMGDQDWMRSGQCLAQIRVSLEQIVDGPQKVRSAPPPRSIRHDQS